jgi:hypothetical protein
MLKSISKIYGGLFNAKPSQNTPLNINNNIGGVNPTSINQLTPGLIAHQYTGTATTLLDIQNQIEQYEKYLADRKKAEEEQRQLYETEMNNFEPIVKVIVEELCSTGLYSSYNLDMITNKIAMGKIIDKHIKLDNFNKKMENIIND